MLFILVMDVLNSLFVKVDERNLLESLSRHPHGQHVSLYADDVTFSSSQCSRPVANQRDSFEVR
jgi:hypothetical protein